MVMAGGTGGASAGGSEGGAKDCTGQRQAVHTGTLRAGWETTPTGPCPTLRAMVEQRSTPVARWDIPPALQYADGSSSCAIGTPGQVHF